jgi:Sec-independent protein translocase protein TatA
MASSNRLIPLEAYPLVVFVVGILGFGAYRLYELAKNPYVSFKRTKEEKERLRDMASSHQAEH